MISRAIGQLLPLVLFGNAVLLAQAPSEHSPDSVPLLSSRIGITAGMGVSYVDAADVVNIVNENLVVSERVPQFRAGVEFFGAAILPVTDRISLKLTYAYLILSYSGSTFFGPGDFTVHAHLPTLILQYVLMDAGLYNLKLGAGAGYHAGSISENYGTVVDRFTSNGPGFLLEMEGNTALSEHLFAHLGADLREDDIGALVNAAGRGAGGVGERPKLHFFSAGAKLGCSYYF